MILAVRASPEWTVGIEAYDVDGSVYNNNTVDALAVFVLMIIFSDGRGKLDRVNNGGFDHCRE